MLKGVQGVVVDENADRTLQRKQVRRVVNGVAQPVFSRLRRVLALDQTTTTV
ncbi:MAG TPA: hypothetical protein VMH05_05315 [Bryobacteraceae bacterium]|nr:hypothetical protein [Bryobacteraceae bacterium]